MAQHHYPEGGEAVREVLRRHNASLRGQRIRTGLDHVTAKDLADGIKKRLEIVEAFARGFNEDVNRFRVLFGYPPVEPQESNADRFLRGLKALAQEFKLESIPVSFSGGLADLDELTPADVDDILQSIREQLQEDADAEAAEGQAG